MHWWSFVANSLPRSFTNKGNKQRKKLPINANAYGNHLQTQNSHSVDNTPNFIERRTIKTEDSNGNEIKRENSKNLAERPLLTRSSILPRRTSYLSSYGTLPKTNPRTLNISDLKAENVDNGTLRRHRSRIKTNPWLTSPEITTPVDVFEKSIVSGSQSVGFSPELKSSCSKSSSSSMKWRSRSFDFSDDSGSHMDLTNFDCEEDHASGSGKHSSGIGLASDGTSISSMESEDLVFFESSPEERKVPNDIPETIIPQVEDEFIYEENFELMVESLSEKHNASCSSLDLMKTDMDVSFVESLEGQNLGESNVELMTSVDDGIGHSDEENTHVYENIPYITHHKLPRSYATVNLAQETESKSEDEYNVEDAEQNHLNAELLRLQIVDSQKLESRKVRKRSVEEIRSSLEAKLGQLRRDKNIVESKILEAQQEERVRMMEKLRYQKHFSNQRGHILVKTLSDLRVRLKEQCQRLQNSYTTVLQLKRDEQLNNELHSQCSSGQA